MKANVANYIIQEMSSRFPMRSEDVVNADLILPGKISDVGTAKSLCTKHKKIFIMTASFL